jgi:hypothetical protein
LQLSLADPAYQLPEALLERFHTLAHFKHRGLHPAYFFTDLADSEVRDRFFELRKQLQSDARSIIAAERPVRPVMPPVETDAAPGMFLTQLFEHTRGVVIGESHSALSSKRLIIDNLEGLAARDVKTLYMEHLLTDLHQADLDRFAETGLMSKRLLHDLKNMDKNFHTDPNGVYTFENLVLKAREHGLEVRAIDCASSYFQSGLPNSVLTSRQQMMNFFASRTIRRHQDVVGPHNWIALVGNSHASTFQNLVPGVAELEGGIGIRVMDVASGQARAPMIDPGQRVPVGFGNDTVHLKSDYLVELATPESTPLTLPVNDRLYRPGMFLIDHSDAANPVIKHRSRDRALHVTPVLRNGDGTLYVERESWLPVHRQPFDDIESLTQALVAFNLKHVK